MYYMIQMMQADGASTDNQLSLTFIAMHVQAWKWRMMTVRTQADGTVELHGSTSADEFLMNDRDFSLLVAQCVRDVALASGATLLN